MLDPNRTLRHAEVMAARLFIRIDFEPSGSALGPGMFELLDRIEKHGSIRKAAGSMDMSYRKAWLLVHNMQQSFGGPVVATEIGGASGGGTQLTELGATLLRTYRRVESRAARAVETELEVLAGMVKANAKPRRSGRRKAVPKQA